MRKTVISILIQKNLISSETKGTSDYLSSIKKKKKENKKKEGIF